MRHTHRGMLCTLLLMAATGAWAQDGYFNTAVLPIVVDSTSFTQAFTFDTPNVAPVTVHATFYPAEGTPQAAIGPVVCTDVHVLPNDGTDVRSLRALCPALVPNSVFGFLSLQAEPSSDNTYNDVPLFAVRSRVSNPAGSGFTVDAVAKATFSSSKTRVTGLRRTEAGPDEPAYQTNCFVANLNQIAAGGNTASKRVNYKLTLATSGNIFYVTPPTFAGYVDVAAGQMVRLLDVFAAAGAPPAAGYYDYMIDFTPSTPSANLVGLMTFCTVQDNTSYQADLRLGKIVYGSQAYAADEPMMARAQYWKADVLKRSFEIPPGAAANTHMVYFRAPDRVKCELLSADWSTPGMPARLTPANGLELRMIDANGLVLGGGSGMTNTGQLFIGERSSYFAANFDGRYTVEVESNGQNAAATRPYSLYCTSGSGNSGGMDLIRYQEAVDRF